MSSGISGIFISILLFLVAVGVQFSGFANLWIAVSLWFLAGLVFSIMSFVHDNPVSRVAKRVFPWRITNSNASSRSTHTQVSIYEEGRLSISDKASFFEDAEHEVIEFGLGLNTLSEYFTGRRPSEFREPVKRLLERGVTYKCVMLDPDSPFTIPYLDDIEEPGYLQKMRDATELLKSVQSEFTDARLPGSFEIFTYSHSPFMHACAVDLAYPNGKIQISNYLIGIRRAECPVLTLTKANNPVAFSSYWKSLRIILDSTTKI